MNTKTYKYTIHSLKGTFFRTQDFDGSHFNQNAFDATNEQFHEWATRRAVIENSDDCSWSLDDRLDFCRRLFNSGCLTVPIEFLEEA